MSFVITTDVFCDGKGPKCQGWIGGIVCTKRDNKGAWEKAKAGGWVKRQKLHYCPPCAAEKTRDERKHILARKIEKNTAKGIKMEFTDEERQLLAEAGCV